MSSRPQLGPFKSITNGDMSGSITGAITIIDKLSMISYSFSWAGTSPVGTVSIQVSNDYAVGSGGDVVNTGTWNVLPLDSNGTVSNTIAVSGNSGNGFIDIDSSAGYAIRPVYTFGSGVGTLQCVAAGKVT